MQKVQVLDCTLRDGGYCNQWEFGSDNIQKIMDGLVNANIDIVECGFLTDRVEYNINVSKYTSVNEIKNYICPKSKGKMYVAMLNYGEYNIENLPLYDGTSIDGIRVAFHKKDMKNAMLLCEKIIKKGYKVFIQAMVTLCYNEKEFCDLIYMANRINPYAFYIVDSFGNMKKEELLAMFTIIENKLNENIVIGFHSHNNMQLAYSNAQVLIDYNTKRNLIVDVSIYGMGRGAGNLNTELFVQFLNEKIGTNYELKPLLAIIDKIINEFYQRNYWGYSLPNYLSAVHNAHPNYANYLDNKKTLTVEAMDEIFLMLDIDKKYEFNKEYIEDIYMKYMTVEKKQTERKEFVESALNGKKVLLIAPGKSSSQDRNTILAFAENKDVATISVNFEYEYMKTDFVFISNLRRFRDLEVDCSHKYIITTNIPAKEDYYRVSYQSLLNDIDVVKDNAGMMALKFLILCGVKEVYLAGFDGYTSDVYENYANSQLAFITKSDILKDVNNGIVEMLSEYKKQIKITFLTKSKYASEI